MFEGFEYNIDKKINIKEANEEAVIIRINSDYKWGSGWTAEEKERFEKTVYTALLKQGFVIERELDSLGCPHLKSTDINNKMDLYLHPMEFTGYISIKDLEKVIIALKDECEGVAGIKDISSKKVYDIGDTVYRNIIIDSTPNIIKCINEYIKKYGPSLYDAGFEFAKECRMDRIGDSSGCLSGLDVDVSTIDNMIKVLDKAGTFDEAKEYYKTHNKCKNEQLDDPSLSDDYDDIDIGDR